MAKIAVVRVRGLTGLQKGVKDTLSMLRLYNKNYCVILEDTPVNMGMIDKVRSFVTYGQIDDATFSEMVAKRGEEYKGKEKDSKGKIDYKGRYLEVEGKKYKKYFRLSPPRKGYGRKGIKKPFSKKGALGNRAEKINDLLKRMI
jgi:large subunit ribosomal protein L30